ncbi:MAG: ABC transporter ATP-binding protein [Lachnospiraceae bacterium]|nr:ABC transporter ATP-binding protein [Lachnospiraceae bacterium]
MAEIEIKDLVKRYKKRVVLNNVSLKVSSGDILGIIGENGAGKSTLMSCMVTLIKPGSGDILIDGESVIAKPEIMRGRVGYVPQEIALYEDLSGIDNLKFWAKTYHIEKKLINERIDKIVEIIGLDRDILKEKVKNYSGGMKRRVNIGVALLNNPDIIVMDEPTVGIDIVSKEYILKVIKGLNKEGKTIIYASHYLDEIEEICNKVCIMNKGNIVDLRKIEDIVKDRLDSKAFRQYYLKANGNC